MARRKRKSTITDADHRQLQSLLNSKFAAAISDQPHLRSLREKLDEAIIIDSHEASPDLITMNSIIRLRHMKDRLEETYTLVYPNEANIVDGKLSILAPTGTAILGYRVGDSVKWAGPGGTIHIRIEKLLMQPERHAVPV